MLCPVSAVAPPDAAQALGHELGLAGLLRGVHADSLTALRHRMADADAGRDTGNGLRWHGAGALMAGALDMPMAAGRMADVAAAAYRRIFAALHEAGMPRLLRVWNYVPGINEPDPALAPGAVEDPADREIYRQFNAGRQAAFVADGQDAFAGSPAACALGIAGDRLAIRFLAGRVPTRAVDNPRQVPAWRYPRPYGQRAPTFSRASLIELDPGRWSLWVSGTASIAGHTSVHPGDVVSQTQETLLNLDAVLAQAVSQEPTLAGRRASDLHACVYLRHAEDRPVVEAELRRAWGSAAVARAVWLRADVCRRELLVEIEGQLDAPSAPRPAPEVRV
jgi:enamine deaminase RidA (YjgF/YER057c/UK114 family)